MPRALVDLLTPPTAEGVEQALLTTLLDQGFPVADWFPGSTPRTIAKMISAGLLDHAQLVPAIASGGFLDLAAETDAALRAAGAEAGWLDLLAREQYSLERAAAVACVQRCTLTCAAGVGPYTRAAGDLIARARSGRLYRNVAAVTVPESGSAPADFKAEETGAAANGDGPDTLVELVTPLPGLAVSNPATAFSGLNLDLEATLNGAGVAAIKPELIDPAVQPTRTRSFVIAAVLPGNVGQGQIRVDTFESGARTSTDVAPIPDSYDAGDNVRLTFDDRGGVFVTGDKYTFSTPGSPITVLGADAEPDASLIARCRGRWPTLSRVPTENTCVAWVRQCSIDNDLGVSKIVTSPSNERAGQVDVVVAGQGGVPSGAAIAILQAYVDARSGVMDHGYVTAARARAVAAGGTVYVRATALAAVQARAEALWSAYLVALPIGGDKGSPSSGGLGVVRLAALEQALMDAGAGDVAGLTLNSAAANLALSPIEVPTEGAALRVALTWVVTP